MEGQTQTAIRVQYSTVQTVSNGTVLFEIGDDQENSQPTMALPRLPRRRNKWTTQQLLVAGGLIVILTCWINAKATRNLMETMQRTAPSLQQQQSPETSTNTQRKKKPSSGAIASNTTYTWIDSSEAILPLVAPFSITETNNNTGEPIYFDPAKGFSFPFNGQVGRIGNKFYPADMLRFQLEGEHLFTKQDALDCLSSTTTKKKKPWIHIDGDSLSRDSYYDIATTLYGMSWNARSKTLSDKEYTTEDIRLTFSSRTATNETANFRTTPNWVDSMTADGCPDVWMYSTGLWDHVYKTSLEHARQRTLALVSSQDHLQCVPYKILRLTAPYSFPKKFPMNKKTKEYNSIATEILSQHGFALLDMYTMMQARPDLTHDGTHYSGPGSLWVVNALLNMICHV